MNKYLEPVFNILLPGLEKADIDYWVYGGIAVATFATKFIRDNPDVDIFIRDKEFSKARSILEDICNKQSDINLKECNLLKRGNYSRPKLEAKIDRVERLSVVPVYLRDDSAVLVFGNGVKEFSVRILEKVERSLSGYRFFTPPNTYVKEIFLNCFRSKKNWKEREDIKKDAKVILSSREFEKYFL